VRFKAPKLAQEVVCAYWRKVSLLRESYGTLSLISSVDLDLMSTAICFYLQDPKPHRSFAFNEILDALEYDLQTHKQTSVPSAFPSQGTDGDDVNGTHTFKIVTTGKTLLLCAPGEDDEIRWLGAIRALIARRTESGQVPGKISKARPPPENGKEAEGGSGGSGGLKVKAKRLSGTGHEVPFHSASS